MPETIPNALPENFELAMNGERIPEEFVVPPGIAARMLASPNVHGKPNADVLRELAPVYPGHLPGRRWQIDFSPAMNEREASLYREPYLWLASKREARGSAWWLNPHADPALRRSIARLERYLAAPFDHRAPEWNWVESLLLPGESLLVVARDDDFTHGVLQSAAFKSWWAKYAGQLTPVEILSSFPFPWAPATPLSSLTKSEEEHRLAISRAARSADLRQIDSAVAAAYGWKTEQTNDEALARLAELNRLRSH